ncbi:MAG: hypothetical protein RH862_12925 [Leptospiraceae bacterium]
MSSRTVRIAWFALAAFGAIAIVRLAYNLIERDPRQSALQSVQQQTMGIDSPDTLSFGTQGFYSRQSTIFLSVPNDSFRTIQNASVMALGENDATVLHQKQSQVDGTTYFLIQARVGQKEAEALLSTWKSQLEVLSFEESRKNLSAEYTSLKARLDSLQESKTRITITPAQFKLSATRELSEEQAALQTRLAEFEEARNANPQQALTAVFLARPSIGISSIASAILDAIWWSIALFGALAILSLFGFLILRLFQGGKDLLSFLGSRLDPKNDEV